MKSVLAGYATVFLVLSSGAVPVVSAPPASMPSTDHQGALYRRVRQAVLQEDDPALYQLVRKDPWGFREVANQLADLAIKEGSDGNADDSAISVVVAGHLAAIYLQTTGDITLARRLRSMTHWKEDEMHQRAATDDLLSRLEGENPPTIRALEEALPLCRKLGDQRCVGLLEGGLGFLRQQQGHVDVAAMDYERAAEAFKEGGELRRQRDAHLARGQLLLQPPRLQAAAASLGAAAAVSEQINDPQGQVGALLLLSQALTGQGRRELGLGALSRAKQVALNRGLDGLAGRAIYMAAHLRDADAPLAASAQDYQAAGRLATNAHDLDTALLAYEAAAEAFAMDDRNSEAIDAVEKALSAARLADRRDSTGGLLLLAGELYGRLKDWKRALSRLDVAISQFRAQKDDAALMRALSLAGTTLLQAKRWSAAVKPLSEVIRLSRHGVHDPSMEGRAEGGLGAAAERMGQMKEAREHYKRSVRLLDSAGEQFESFRMKKILAGLAKAPASPSP